MLMANGFYLSHQTKAQKYSDIFFNLYGITNNSRRSGLQKFNIFLKQVMPTVKSHYLVKND